MKLYIYISVIVLLFTIHPTVKSQELNARITVNSDKITSTNKQVFTTLENALMEFVNTRKWTQASFSNNEKIDCSFNLIINEQSNETSFTAELQITARRPVYNSTYITSIFNHRDTEVNFEYMENTPIEYIENRLESNLVATLSFYAYLILGLDFDSFAPSGGNPYFRMAQQIATEAQSYSRFSGWTPFERSNSRHGIITALTDEALKPYRNFWYTYHRKGLDEMAANADRGRTNIVEALPVLKDIRDARPNTVLLSMFADTKLDELVNIYSKANMQEKKAGYDLLNSLYPSMSDRLAPLKK